MDMFPNEDAPVFVISIAAELAGMHPQTLRQYDRLGLVSPGRSAGGGRRYSPRDVALLRTVAQLSADGVSLAGIKRIVELEAVIGELTHQVEHLKQQVGELMDELHEARRRSTLLPAVRYPRRHPYSGNQ
jgi:MerR family transcriptional regulator, heat shock protein HspR